MREVNQARTARNSMMSASSVLALLASISAAAPAVAQSPADVTEVSDIIVTGVRGKPRSALDSPTPVDVLSGKDLADAGHANLYQDMQLQVPSFNYTTKAGGGTSSAILSGGLRGLNPDHTLVLVNGMRFHHTSLINVGQGLYNGTAPVDLGMIPTSSINRIEVLREGAAAQYGSDAISGVINVILKDTPGGSLSAQYGQNMDRSDGEQLLIRGDYGFKYSDTGSLNLFFSATDQNASDRSYPIASTVQLYPRLANGQLDPREATVNRQISKGFGLFPTKQWQVGFNASDQVGDVELFAFGTFSKRTTDIIFPPIIPNQKEALPEIYPNFTYVIQRIRETDGQLAIGARGTISDWDWSLSSTAGENHAPQDTLDSLNPSLGPTSPTEFYIGSLTSQEWVNSLDVTRKLDMSSGGSLQVSFGLQHRFERFKIAAGDLASYQLGTYVRPAGQAFAGQFLPAGAFFAPGLRPADAGSWNRNVLAGYVELGYEPTERLFIGAAGRVERYDDTSGTSVVGKVDGRYKATDWLSLRGSFGNGFRAPSLAQQHYSKASTTPSNAAANLGQPITNQILPVGTPAAIALGASPLKPEKSIDASLGFTMNPAPNFNVTVDGYIVKLSDRIALGSILQGAAVANILRANGIDPNLTGQYFTNAVDTRTSGVDVIATYRADLGNAGDLRLTAAFNYNHTKITDIAPNPAALNALGATYVQVDRVTQGYLTDAIPETKVALGANWTVDKFTFNLQGVRYGSFETPGANATLDRFFKAKWITNAMVKYNITKQVSFAVGADNLFNVYPPANNIPLAQYGYNQYPRFGPYGFTGGFYYGRIQIDF
ncbi:TonB-dependent receptor plug domain-containing protein [Sphingomonas crocodyli]|uniref:TonB-dependent receptor n=1 Tax=Sphingomonas crocodyli TaxID=1979270 RepID=A0A437M7N2_9SPHN|nr:TonB-dependent receptor [Sphingomonas crocodyli]RVT93504.1 TonB-dependent receptor [Sphingomonas crocodyli]